MLADTGEWRIAQDAFEPFFVLVFRRYSAIKQSNNSSSAVEWRPTWWRLQGRDIAQPQNTEDALNRSCSFLISYVRQQPDNVQPSAASAVPENVIQAEGV